MKLRTISPNAVELTLSNGSQVLFSYGTPVAVSINFKSGPYSYGVYKTSHEFGPTTSKHINTWTNTTRTLSQGEIEALVDLSGNPNLS
jgi:hypothetical protein